MEIGRHYYCECCGTLYDQRDARDKCEKSHMMLKRIRKSKYDPVELTQVQQSNHNYPKWISIEFEDGTTIRYQR